MYLDSHCCRNQADYWGVLELESSDVGGEPKSEQPVVGAFSGQIQSIRDKLQKEAKQAYEAEIVQTQVSTQYLLTTT